MCVRGQGFHACKAQTVHSSQQAGQPNHGKQLKTPGLVKRLLNVAVYMLDAMEASVAANLVKLV